jgi:ABC-type transporter Mla subunit MlaD
MDQANCEDKLRLLMAYQAATEAYSKAVSELATKIGVTRKAEYDKVNRAAEQARYASMDARDRLERHTAEHGC